MIHKNHLDHCGYVAILGRPNVGKSTLLNRILGQKISITTAKPQTTRHQILGIKTTDTSQVIYVDTPGLHREAKRAMNRYMNRAAASIINDVDVIVFMIEGLKWTDEEQFILNKLLPASPPVILLINKVDKIKNKQTLLPFIKEVKSKLEFLEIIPVSAKSGENIEQLESVVTKLLPAGDALFPEQQVTDRSERFLASEVIREKLMLRLNKELPYHLTVEIEKYAMENNTLHIGGLIWVERESQKGIIIGKHGESLKAIGELARRELEKILEQKIYLSLWVKVKSNWSDDERALQSLGYRE